MQNQSRHFASEIEAKFSNSQIEPNRKVQIDACNFYVKNRLRTIKSYLRLIITAIGVATIVQTKRRIWTIGLRTENGNAWVDDMTISNLSFAQIIRDWFWIRWYVLVNKAINMLKSKMFTNIKYINKSSVDRICFASFQNKSFLPRPTEIRVNGWFSDPWFENFHVRGIMLVQLFVPLITHILLYRVVLG